MADMQKKPLESVQWHGWIEPPSAPRLASMSSAELDALRDTDLPDLIRRVPTDGLLRLAITDLLDGRVRPLKMW
uniref:Uncharacterized protein n=1 Tax=Magnetococcus massalia (strain MO-1) TaxID=451514 RepID=A0A1S7LKX8_MAGMO|nr:protein of unknown function [Candidatus Magnetococcus massalia]